MKRAAAVTTPKADPPWPAAPPPRTLYVAEPRSAWQLRQPVVVDCSVLAALLFAEPNCEEATRLLLDRAVHAPTLLPYELANVAAKKLCAGATAAEVDTALADFADQRIDLHPAPPDAVHALATRFGLSAYDAAYLWLAADLKAVLATFDRQLGNAAHRHLGAAD